jgi:hypothetical protein
MHADDDLDGDDRRGCPINTRQNGGHQRVLATN